MKIFFIIRCCKWEYIGTGKNIYKSQNYISIKFYIENIANFQVKQHFYYQRYHLLYQNFIVDR